jgi:hypothetical protein
MKVTITTMSGNTRNINLQSKQEVYDTATYRVPHNHEKMVALVSRKLGVLVSYNLMALVQ